jgi:hypothetical protein
MNTYRILQNGECIWQGRAYDPEHAEEKCFDDETPGGFERFTLQVWGTVRLSKSMRGKDWKTVYTDQCLAAY